MARGTPFLVGKTHRTNIALTAGAALEAAAAANLLAMVTLADAATTKPAFTCATRALTVAAHRFCTALADIGFVGGDGPAAVAAVLTIPEGQLDEGALAVVGPQEVRHEMEKIQQSTLEEGLTNGGSSIALAKDFIDDMRVGDARSGRGGMRLECDHSVGQLRGQSPQIESDLEGP